MKLVSINPISLKRIPAEPFNRDTPEDGAWPEMIIAKISTTVTDELVEEWRGEYELKFMTRLVTTDASAPVPALEALALRQLAAQLRDVAAALEAETSASA